MAVEAESAQDDMVEAAHEEVGEEVRGRLVVCAEDLVTMRASEPLVAAEVGAAVRVGDHHLAAGRGVVDGRPDPLRSVVELRRYRPHLDVPAAARGDLLHVQRQGAAADDDGAQRPTHATGLRSNLVAASRVALIRETPAGR